MKRSAWFLAALVATTMTIGQVDAALINGDFETGDFTGWTVFSEFPGEIGTPAVVSFDTTGDAVPSLAARFQVGTSDSGVFGGGGILQNVALSSGLF